MIEPITLASDLRVVIGQLIRRLRDERRDLTLEPGHGARAARPAGSRASISDLAADERVRPQSMASTVAALADRGWSSAARIAVDGAGSWSTLTAAGREALADDRRRREGWLADAIERDLTERERRVLAEAPPCCGGWPTADGGRGYQVA